MSRVGNFDAFYHGTRAALLHQTYALTGNIDGAASAVEHAYANAWSHWTKVSYLDDPLAWVRNEAWRVVSSQLPRRHFNRRRRLQTDVAESQYAERLRRLHTLPMSQRRVVVLHHLAGMPADQVARQVGVATSAAANALVGGEGLWVASAAPGSAAGEVSLKQALRELEVDTSKVTLMRASAIRRAGDKRQRRHTLVGVAAAAALLVGGGALIAQEPTTSSTATPASEAVPEAESPSVAAALPSAPVASPDERKISSSDTLSLVDMRTISPRHNQWAITLDSTGPLNEEGAYTDCQRRTLADPALDQIVLRQFEALGGPPSTKALQVMEQSETPAAAEDGYAEMESWFTACQQEGVRLVSTIAVKGLGDEARLVVLRQDGRRPTYSTVGVVRTGTLSTTVVVTTDGDRPVPPRRLAKRLASNVRAVCEVGDGDCAAKPRLTRVPPLPQPEYPGFLVSSDLPQVGSVRQPWAGTNPRPAKDNPSETACDQVQFGQQRNPRARVFVIPDAKRIPRKFGLSETVARFPRPGAAAGFIDSAAQRVAGCADREINAAVVAQSELSRLGVQGQIWNFEFELSDGAVASYRVGLVRRGSAVAQVTLSPAGDLDMSPADFRGLVLRAGERLAALPDAS